jgi:light-regulated signal transduction histidine kinase (bacteriophytochrome)
LNVPRSAIQRYGLAIACVAVALGGAILTNRYHFRGVEFPFFLFAVAISAWYAGTGPGITAFILSGLAFNYYFTEPYYTLFVTRDDLVYYFVFLLFASLFAWFSVVRRRVEQDLRQSRDKLEKEVVMRRSLNEELEQRSDELQASNKELEAFAYSTSHDLRAPLRHMVGYTELLQKHASATFDEKSLRYMATILEAAKKMGTLIDDLLAFSRIGRAETRETSVSLEYLVNDVLREMPAQDGRKIDWKIGKLPEVYGDRSMLRLALVNLISNAVKFTRTRSRPEIEIGCVEKKNNRAVVFVKDNGVGFDMKYAHKLFGVFQRLHSTEVFEGTGIGLATVQRIIHRHRGRVWAESAVDKGATFYFSVPTQGK